MSKLNYNVGYNIGSKIGNNIESNMLKMYDKFISSVIVLKPEHLNNINSYMLCQ